MKNFICTGERIIVTAPAGGLVPGAAYVVGNKVGIVISGGLEGEDVALATEGVFELPKVAGVINQGQKLYVDGSGNLTTIPAGNTYVGYAFKASLTGDATGFVTLVDNPGATQAIKVPQCATADGSDAGTTQTLANALKGKVNAIISALTDAGLMANA